MTRPWTLSRRSVLRWGATLAASVGGGVQACAPIFGHRIDNFGQVVRDVVVPMAQGAVSPAKGLRLQRTIVTGQGNAAGGAWSDDGTTLYLANSESDSFSALRIDASAPAHPRLTGNSGGPTYEAWAVAQRGGMLAFSTSLGNTTVSRIDPSSWAILWSKRMPAPGHAIATNGVYVYVPLESNPGRVVVLDAHGAERAGATVPGTDWSNGGRAQSIYGIALNEHVNLLAVSVFGLDTVFLFDLTRPDAPVLRSSFKCPAGSLATAGTRLWTNPSGELQCWDISSATAPRLLGRYANSAVFDATVSGNVIISYGQLQANAAGTRVYAVYSTANVGNHAGDPGRSAGLAIFDVGHDTPAPLATNEWKVTDRANAVPLGLAVSSGGVAAVTYYNFGVRFHSVTRDVITPLGALPTSGESRDVYVDAAGYTYSFGDYLISSYDPGGAFVSTFFDGDYHEGAWIPFKDGLVLCPGGFAGNQGITGWSLARGEIAKKSFHWDNETSFALAFDGTHLYQGGTTGVVVYTVGSAADGYALAPVGTLPIPDVSGGTAGVLRAVALSGTTLWGTGENCGVVAVDVSAPAAPRLLRQDKFSYAINGAHCGVAVARNRVYVGCGSGSVRIYDGSRLSQTGAIAGYFVCFLDTVKDDLLVVSHYGDGIQPFSNEGVYVFDLRRTPDGPSLLASWPGGDSPNFRSRYLGGTVARCPLWGVERLSIDNYP